MAISRQRNPTKFQKTLALNNFYFNAPAMQDRQWLTPIALARE
jgi:hypothetical protein